MRRRISRAGAAALALLLLPVPPASAQQGAWQAKAAPEVRYFPGVAPPPTAVAEAPQDGTISLRLLCHRSGGKPVVRLAFGDADAAVESSAPPPPSSVPQTKAEALAAQILANMNKAKPGNPGTASRPPSVSLEGAAAGKIALASVGGGTFLSQGVPADVLQGLRTAKAALVQGGSYQRPLRFGLTGIGAALDQLERLCR